MSTVSEIAVAYIPVLHRGYFDFLNISEERGIRKLYLIGDEVLSQHGELDYLNRKDRIRALPLSQMMMALEAISSLSVFELGAQTISEIQKAKNGIFTPKEDISRIIYDVYFPTHPLKKWPVFVRWNRDNIDEDKEPDVNIISADEFQKKVIKLMDDEANKSFDWWRQVGAALIKDGEVIYVTHNEHLPEEQQPYIDGDVRSIFKKGIHINYNTAAHAEVVAIALAAKKGVSTENAELYVTDFPCPYCARLIAKSGIKKIYFIRGYAVLDGDRFLKEEGVDVMRIDVS